MQTLLGGHRSPLPKPADDGAVTVRLSVPTDPQCVMVLPPGLPKMKPPVFYKNEPSKQGAGRQEGKYSKSMKSGDAGYELRIKGK